MMGQTGRKCETIYNRIRDMSEYPERVALLARIFIGTPYCDAPLGGSPGHGEKLVDRLDCFDCVTYVESVLALASSESREGFRSFLQRLRYDGRAPTWENRLHYTSLWFMAQERRGLLRIVHPEKSGKTVRRLSAVQGVSPVDQKLAFHSWSIPSGFSRGIMAFGSTRNDLDVFHMGFYFDGALFHASRSAGSVISEALVDFLDRESGAGLMLATFHPG